MSSLMEKMLKNSKLKSCILKEDETLTKRDFFDTGVYTVNLALSGKLKGGVSSGITSWAGPSRHFKTGFGLLCVAAYLKENEDAVCLFYDSERGAALEFFESYGIDTNRVLRSLIENIEQLKFDLSNHLDNLTEEDKVFIFIDSLGNLASKKEAEDALKENSAADMTRAKEIKSLFRIVTPVVNNKNIPMHVVMHTYDTMEMFSKRKMSGGQGPMLASDSVLFVGKRQIKDGKEFLGSDFVLNAEKSRYIREKSVIPISVTFENGIDKYSGLLDIAIAAGVVVKPKMGWYSRVIVPDDKNWRAKNTGCDEFWEPILNNETQVKLIEDLYSLKSSKLISEDDFEFSIDEETGEVLE